MKKILVTGGAGFIGSHLVDKLLKENTWEVTVIDDFNNFYNPEIKYHNIRLHLTNPLYNLERGSICDEQLLLKIFSASQFDCIVHLAARAGVRPSLVHPLLYEETNIKGTMNLLEFARKTNTKQFIFGSSSSVYGDKAKVPFSEEVPFSQPISPYAMTKAAGELMCYTYSHLYDLRCVCLRFFTVYGPRQRPDLAINKFARLITEGEPIPVYGDGSTRRDYTYIEDIISGIRAAIDYEASNFEAINLGESQTIDLIRLINLLEDQLQLKAVIDWLPMQPGDVPQTFADISKAKRLLNYDPQTKIEEGIARFVHWFQQTESVQFATK